MQFHSVIALLATLSAVSAAPGGGGGDSDSQCTTEQANKCCTGLLEGILNIGILPGLCLPLVGSCNNQVACCEANGVRDALGVLSKEVLTIAWQGLLNCVTIQL
ncbi:hypothetical protein BDV29DRAFT_192905 [Aspergillus leporis]|uniref:Hydrophobin n=1 Tax=Aspergillus leporis TaxID=41062 RepID=A0A5N5WW33_9EURO|nr:hypothetical protein BDV29DRAFT_192905 [Aspergillus leporis]